MPDIRLLQASVDPDDTSDIRILVDGISIKYLTIAPGVYEANNMCFEPALIAKLPPLPLVDWKEAHIDRDPATGSPHFATTTNIDLPAITDTWHPRMIDYLDLCWGNKLRSNVYEVTLEGSESPLIAKIARFSFEIPRLDDETKAYRWIDGKGIGPKFHGHVTEEGRTIGFIMERIEGSRHAGPEDLQRCRQALQRIHALKIKHGDVNRQNFLVGAEVVTIFDFDFARRCNDAEALEAELRSLEGELLNTSERGGMVEETGDGA